MPEYIRPLFCEGRGPFRWVALSGEASDIHRTDHNFFKPFGNVGAVPTGIPTGTYSLPKNGAQTEAPAQFYGPYNFLLAPTVDIEPSDAMTLIVRNHTLKFGVDVFRNRKDQNSRQDSPEGNINFSSSDINSSGDPLADSLMGNYNSLGQVSADPVGHFRFTGYEGYVNDDWRVSRILSVELGVRYEYTVPTYTQGNDMVNFLASTFTPINGLIICSPDNEVALVVSPCNPSGGPKTAFLPTNTPVIPAGDGNIMDCPPTAATQGACNSGGYIVDGIVRVGNTPADQAIRFPNAYSPFVQDVPAGGQRGFFKPEGVWGPRVGLAITPMNKLVIRGGYGIFYDKPEGNLVFAQTALPPLVQNVQYNFGNLGALPGAVAPTVSSFTAINPNIVVARVQQYSLSLQYQLPDRILFQAAYAGNYGWHELRQPNINLPSYAGALAFTPANGQGPTLNQARPFLGLGDITEYQSDGYSDYNALQVSAAKTTGLVTTQVSYTRSKTLQTNSGYNDNNYPMCAFTCVVNGTTVNWQSYVYGESSFDVRNILAASFTFNDPFYRTGKGLMGEAIGGWSLTGLIRAQSGFPLTPTAGTNIQNGSGVACPLTGTSVNCLSSTENNRAFGVTGQSINPGVGNTSCAASSGLCYFNIAAFSDVGMSTAVGTGPIGALIGPGILTMDLSMRKTIFLGKEGYSLALQVDCNACLNHPNLSNPSVNPTSTSFGRITGVVAGSQRTFQFDTKFTF